MGSRGVGIGGSVRGVGSLIRGLPVALLILPALLQVTSALPEVIKLGRLAVLVLHPSTFYNHLCLAKKKHFPKYGRVFRDDTSRHSLDPILVNLVRVK